MILKVDYNINKTKRSTSGIVHHLVHFILVKGRHNANILLSECDGCDGIQILIGGWSNKKSVLRAMFRNGTDLSKINHRPLSDEEFTSFWINAVTKEDGSFEVSVGYGSCHTLLKHQLKSIMWHLLVGLQQDWNGKLKKRVLQLWKMMKLFRIWYIYHDEKVLIVLKLAQIN